jgi:S-adenosylmethionine hydrolase
VGIENKALSPIIRTTNKIMSTTISKDLKKQSITIDKFGNIISDIKAEDGKSEMQKRQEQRARRLGLIK